MENRSMVFLDLYRQKHWNSDFEKADESMAVL